MPVHPWELRAETRPLELAATRWTDTATILVRRGDELIDSARRATEGWDATAAESYAEHRRQVLEGLDRFALLAVQVAASLRSVSALLVASQKELDRSWATVALVPHEVVGESRHLVFHAAEDDDRGQVTRGEAETEEIRGRLGVALDQEGARLRAVRTELVTVRTELATLAGGTFAHFLPPPTEPGVGAGLPASPATVVPGSAQGGISALPPIAPIAVSTPDLGGLSSAGVASLASVAIAAGRSAGARDPRRTPSSVPPMGPMTAGAMGGTHAATASRSTASGRPGSTRVAVPRLAGGSDGRDGEGAGTARGNGAATTAREAARAASREAEREAKRAALAEKRAERAARKAARDAQRDDERDGEGQERPPDEEFELPAALDEGEDEEAAEGSPDDPASGSETDAPDRSSRR